MACIDRGSRSYDSTRRQTAVLQCRVGGRNPRKEGRTMWKLAMLMEWSSTYHFCSRKEWLHATRVTSHVLCTRPVVRGRHDRVIFV